MYINICYACKYCTDYNDITKHLQYLHTYYTLEIRGMRFEIDDMIIYFSQTGFTQSSKTLIWVNSEGKTIPYTIFHPNG